jgi:protocatechuate 3,4-dioxygenase beta subunit
MVIGVSGRTWAQSALLVVAWAALASTAQNALDRRALRTQLDVPAITIEQYERIREALRRTPAAGTATLVSTNEPGRKLLVTGTLRDAAGKPIAGALLHVFQTDAEGRYTRERVMDEPHARLFEFIRTGVDGRFEFSTIRPGGYPGRPDRQGEEWRIPSHVHFEIDAAGFAHRGFQMVFEDDPRMTPYWHEWARKARHPVVKVTRGPDGVDRVVNDVVLAAG